MSDKMEKKNASMLVNTGNAYIAGIIGVVCLAVFSLGLILALLAAMVSYLALAFPNGSVKEKRKNWEIDIATFCAITLTYWSLSKFGILGVLAALSYFVIKFLVAKIGTSIRSKN